MENKNKNLWLILGLLVIVIVVAAIFLSQNKKGSQPNTINNNQAAPVNTDAPATQAPTAVVSSNPVLKDAVVVLPGASPVTKDNKVVTNQGEQTDNSVAPLSPKAPMQTQPIDKDKLGTNVIKIGVSAAGFSPNQFTVNAGAPTTVALTSTDGTVHVLIFSDPSLSAVAIGVMPDETRAITFNAPTKAGEYAFHCDVPGHNARGEAGKMIVK